MASNFRGRAGAIKCLGCFHGKQIRDIREEKTHKHSQVAKNAIIETAQKESFFEQKYYSNVCQTVCLAIKCCECKSSLVTEVNKTERQPVIVFSQYSQQRAQNLSAKHQDRINSSVFVHMQTHFKKKNTAA